MGGYVREDGGVTAVEEAREAGRFATLRRETFSALSIPNFRLYFAGQSISLVGTWMQMVAQAWLVLEITGSATWVGLTFAAQTLPILLVGPYGGLVADRTDKRRLLVALQAVMGALALVLAVLTLTDTVQLWRHRGNVGYFSDRFRFTCAAHQLARPGALKEPAMKSGIHPNYVETTVTCTCGNTFTTRSTAKNGVIHADVCSACHPFYTGKQKILDTGGRVAKFEARFGKKADSK